LSRRRGRGEVVGESGGREGRVGGGGRGCGEEGEKRGEDDVVVVVVVEGKREERTRRRKSNVGGAGLARGVHGGWHKKRGRQTTTTHFNSGQALRHPSINAGPVFQ